MDLSAATQFYCGLFSGGQERSSLTSFLLRGFTVATARETPAASGNAWTTQMSVDDLTAVGATIKTVVRQHASTARSSIGRSLWANQSPV